MYIFNEPSSNNIYLIFAFIIVFIVIYASFLEREEETSPNNVVQIENNYIDIKYEDLDHHLCTLESHLNILSASFDISNYPKIKNALELAQNDLDLITNTRNGISLEDIIKLEKDKPMYSNDIDHDDENSKNDEEFRIKVDKLLDSIKKIKNILRRDRLPRLKLTNIHRLLSLMNKHSNKKVDDEYDSLIMKKSLSYEIMDETYLRRNSNPNLSTKFSQISHHEGSYEEISANDSENILYKIGFKNKSFTKGKKMETDMSQILESSSDNILSKKKTFDTIQYCDINKLKQEHENMKKISTDCEFNRSLRNDYDHLDC